MITSTRLRTAVGATAIVLLTATPALALGPFARSSGTLSDFAPSASGPFDGARARVQLVESSKDSHAVFTVKGIGASANGNTYGAHLHDGPCIAGNGPAALGHYNAHAHAGVDPVKVNDETEIWLDFTVDDGTGTATAKVPFVPKSGARSVVIHAQPTNPSTGGAGDRLACLTVSW
ncbi:superoxide dismutase [Knoellia sinensis KCTC 19936]|uniref:Superoxide dismutase n=1 Tax=Knoellia sinensis KCTC 19936 TaxID=1385520 RepID=A0A0A0JF04_9MICO|nr:superoxide dismutase family protein [Knoellia sinensis]KGN34191.1 superoxide dismutase [Knoellia sinensis KCTC 19936]